MSDARWNDPRESDARDPDEQCPRVLRPAIGMTILGTAVPVERRDISGWSNGRRYVSLSRSTRSTSSAVMRDLDLPRGDEPEAV